MPLILKEFGCGHSVRTGTQIISWILMITSFIGLFGMNYYFFDAKKIKFNESPLMLLVVDFVFGIVLSVVGLYGAYHNRRILLKSLFIYLLSQFLITVIIIWFFFIAVFPDLPPFPRKTRFMILNIIMFVTWFFGLLSYAATNVYSHYKQVSDDINDREFLVPVDHHDVLVHEDAFPSNMSSVSGVTTRSYLTTTQVNERHQRFTGAFSPPAPVPEEVHPQTEQTDSKELLWKS